MVSALAGPVTAACQGQDLLARMAGQAPGDYAAIEQDARAMPFGKGRLFRIDHPGLPPSFLFGTLHIVDPRLAALTPLQQQTLRSATIVALETLDFVGPAPPSLSAHRLEAEASQRADHLLAPAEFHRLVTLVLSRGFSAELAHRLKASALALMLDLPACALRDGRVPSFLDAQVLAAARDTAKKVIGLESTLEKISITDGLMPAVQTALLAAVIAQSNFAENVVATSVKLYLEGRIGMLLAWTRSPRPIAGVAEAGVPPAFIERIITDRTRRMRDRLLPLLASGSVFIAIGATHIPGPEGLANLLVEAGYHVERLE